MENASLLAAEYGFFLKMCAVAIAAVVAGILIRRRGSGAGGSTKISRRVNDSKPPAWSALT